MALCIGFGHQRQMLAFTRAREFKRKFVDARNTRAGEHGCFCRHFLGQPTMHAPAVAGILTFGVFADHHPVDILSFAQRAGDAWQHARRPHIGILIKALADRQAQAPQ